MIETIEVYGEGGYDPDKPNGNVVAYEDIEVADNNDHAVVMEARAVIAAKVDPDQQDPSDPDLLKALAVVLSDG